VESRPDPLAVDPAFGVYVHIPFCAQRCGYCDFATWTDRHHLVDEYVDACVRDLERHARTARPATSVFFGGGTPSLIAANQLTRILAAIDRDLGAEVTIECNPDTVDREKFETYAAAGATRISLGAQSFVPQVLRSLDRTHEPANVARAVTLARAAGIEHVNVDLIYGTPGETLADWERSLRAVLDLGVGHVSAYALTIEPGTPLGRAIADGEFGAPDDDDQADKYALADDLLAANGFVWYEISNWARPGEECRHNLLYWTMGEYLGVGCAAHGHTSGTRWWNARTPDRYIEALASTGSAEVGRETLDPAARAEEAFALGLRTRHGAIVSSRALHVLDELADEDLVRAVVEPSGTRVTLTCSGRLLASDVTARLLLAGGAADEDGAPAGTRYH